MSFCLLKSRSLRSHGGGFCFLCLLFSSFFLLPVTRGQSASPAAGDDNVSTSQLIAQLRSRLVEATAELNRQQAQYTMTNLPAGASMDEALEHRMLLQRLVITYESHLSDLQDIDALRQRQQEVCRNIDTGTTLSSPPPYSVLLVDELLDDVQSAKTGIDMAETTRQVADKLAEDFTRMLGQCDEKLRRLNERLESAKDPTVVSQLSWHRELERMRERFSAANIAYSKTKGQIADLEHTVYRQELTLAQRQLAVALRNYRFPRSDLDKVLKNLADNRRQVEKMLADATAELHTREKTLADARDGLRKISVLRIGTNKPVTSQIADVDRLQDLVDLRRAQVQTASRRVDVLRQIAEWVNSERSGWEMRYALFSSKDLVKLQELDARLRTFAERMQLVKDSYRQQMDLAARKVHEQRRLLRNKPDNSTLINEWLATYEERHDFYDRGMREAERLSLAATHWRESAEMNRKALPFTDRVRDLFTEISTFGSKLWNFELYIAEDTIIVDGQPVKGQRSITVGKIISALIILIGGYLVCILLARLLKRILTKRLNLEEGTANLVQRWAKFFLIVTLIIASMVSVKIPLTIFAFLGGALAIGVGFGTQTLLKNFISGIILLAERPLRVGDILEVEGMRGRVVSIGIRSSVIRNADGIEILVPNSAFLESKVTNWTYSNRHVRFALRLGVAYGSDPSQVANILDRVVREHRLVLAQPAPQVLFEDFGDNALMFCLHYWLEMTPTSDVLAVASELRYAIERSFSEQGIVVAFPQRDIHLETGKPLQVEITGGQQAVRELGRKSRQA